MINYSPLPSRVRRIAKVYDYCIDSVVALKDNTIGIKLKLGYTAKKETAIVTSNMEEVMYFLKSVTKPSSREIKTALYGFNCPIDGRAVKKGENYADLGGLKICIYCNVQD